MNYNSLLYIFDIEIWLWNNVFYSIFLKWNLFESYEILITMLALFYSKTIMFFFIKQVNWYAIVFSTKFFMLIALLIFVRGGIPRYRYDFLTKIGWIKMLSLSLVFFLSFYLLLLLY